MPETVSKPWTSSYGPPPAAVLERPSVKDIAREVVANYLFTVPMVRKWRLSKGRTHVDQFGDDVIVEQSIRPQFATFRRAMAAIPGGVEGRVFLELGPGDVVPVALLALAMGAKEYVGCDRFPGDLTNASAMHLYELARPEVGTELLATVTARGLDVAKFPWLPADSKSWENSSPVRFHAVDAERIDRSVAAGSVDVVFSYNVIEHVLDPGAVFGAAFRVLRPGGVMVHRIDYGPHACWLKYQNPLMFLTVSEGVWQAMGSNRGNPNRYRHSEILGAMHGAGFTAEVLETRECEAAVVEAARPKLARWRDVSTADLRVLDALIVARKPA